jgi:hypothetical protein
MLGAHRVLSPRLGNTAPQVGDISGEKVFFAEFPIFNVLKTKGHSMVKHGHPCSSAAGFRNLTSEFHGGRDLGSRGSSGNLGTVER